MIPQAAWSAPAQRMLQYIPAPNTAAGAFATSAYIQTVEDDKAGVRLDGKTRWGYLSAYYFIDSFNLDNPYPVAQSGASVPGFVHHERPRDTGHGEAELLLRSWSGQLRHGGGQESAAH
jgi:hypothetical protein